jgi:hypothetical protein
METNDMHVTKNRSRRKTDATKLAKLDAKTKERPRRSQFGLPRKKPEPVRFGETGKAK